MWLLGSVALATGGDAEAVRDGMGAHFRATEDLQKAVIQGDLSAVRRHASRLVTDDADGTLGDAQVRIGPFVRALAASTSTEQAAHRLALLGSACGTCHLEQGATRSFIPPADPNLSVMGRHADGAAWMWAGLVANDDAVFQQGAARFSVPSDGWTSAPRAVDGPLREAREAAGMMRSRAYGQLLATCAGCHTSAVRDAPPVVFVSEMHQRSALLAAARDAVHSNKRRAWQAAGDELSNGMDTLLDGGQWQPWTEQLQVLGWRLGDETNRLRAGELVASLAQHCGACHQAVGGGPTPPQADAVDDSTAGLQQLWLSLLSGDDEAWRLGAEGVGRPDLADVPPSARSGAFATLLVK